MWDEGVMDVNLNIREEEIRSVPKVRPETATKILEVYNSEIFFCTL